MPGDVVPARAPRRRVRRLEPVVAMAESSMDVTVVAPPSPPAPLTPAVDPAGPSAETLARGHTVRAIETLGALMEAEYKEGTRLAAALALLDRGWGKIGSAAKEEAHDGDDGFDPASGRERLARELDRLARREGADAGSGPADGS